MFCFAALEVWNVLPLSVRHSDRVSQFKCCPKSHCFSLVFAMLMTFEHGLNINT